MLRPTYPTQTIWSIDYVGPDRLRATHDYLVQFVELPEEEDVRLGKEYGGRFRGRLTLEDMLREKADQVNTLVAAGYLVNDDGGEPPIPEDGGTKRHGGVVPPPPIQARRRFK